MKVFKQKGVIPDQAVEQLYSDNPQYIDWRDILPQIQAMLLGVDGCLTEAQVEGLRAELPLDRKVHEDLMITVGANEGGPILALKKAQEIIAMARLQCKNCTKKDSCPRTDAPSEG
ncbi:hypothetical protein JW752_04685 [Candidatus Peregrinibacteria bacterium]|nr:hypothetical protein [Candidatus Peregrinibacteria bacterium]